MARVIANIRECPPTPERLDQCPATPDSHAKSPFSSSSDTDEYPIAGESPPPNCAICLGKCKNKCFTDSCLHQFCFDCLLQWSRIKAECPLCKQQFNSIIHNVKSIDQYEQYLVRPNAAQSVCHRLDFLLEQPPRFRYSATVQVRPTESDAIQDMFVEHATLPFMRRSRSRNMIPPNLSGAQLRQHIYDNFLYALPLPDITGRFRETSAIIFRRNTSHVSRVMGWIKREIQCLILHRQTANAAVRHLESYLNMYDITSFFFRQSIAPFLGMRTSHFIHELNNFARSPYDMFGYDRNVRYTTFDIMNQNNILNDTGLIIDSSSDDDIRFNGQRVNRTQFTIETRSNNQTVILTGSFSARDDTSAPTSSSLIPSSSTSTSFIPSSFGAPSFTNVIISSESDSDDVQFVMEQKPPHLRTPDRVSLDSDSDVVFVEEKPRDKKRSSKSSKRNKVILPVTVDSSSDSQEGKSLAYLQRKLINESRNRRNATILNSSQPGPSSLNPMSSHFAKAIRKNRKKTVRSSATRDQEHLNKLEKYKKYLNSNFPLSSTLSCPSTSASTSTSKILIAPSPSSTEESEEDQNVPRNAFVNKYNENNSSSDNLNALLSHKKREKRLHKKLSRNINWYDKKLLKRHKSNVLNSDNNIKEERSRKRNKKIPLANEEINVNMPGPSGRNISNNNKSSNKNRNYHNSKKKSRKSRRERRSSRSSSSSSSSDSSALGTNDLKLYSNSIRKYKNFRSNKERRMFKIKTTTSTEVPGPSPLQLLINQQNQHPNKFRLKSIVIKKYSDDDDIGTNSNPTNIVRDTTLNPETFSSDTYSSN